MGGSGDDTAFGEFAAARLPASLRYAYLLCGEHATAEDIVQGALARTFASWPRVRTKGNPEQYVRRAILNAVCNRGRRRWREQPTATPPERPTVGRPDADYVEREAMWAALRLLPPRQRAVLVLRYYDELSEAEIAAVLGCSRGTVKSQAARGLEKLRQVLHLSDQEQVGPR